MAALPMNSIVARFAFLASALFFLLTHLVSAQYTSWDQLPACGKQCIQETFSGGDPYCSKTDYSCICTSTSFETNVPDCVDSLCGEPVADQVLEYTGGAFCSNIPPQAVAPYSSGAASTLSSTPVESNLTSSITSTTTVSTTSSSSSLTQAVPSTINTPDQTPAPPASTITLLNVSAGPSSSSSSSSNQPVEQLTVSSMSTTSASSASSASTTANSANATISHTSPGGVSDSHTAWVAVVAILGTLAITFCALWIGQNWLRRRRRMRAQTGDSGISAGGGNDTSRAKIIPPTTSSSGEETLTGADEINEKTPALPLSPQANAFEIIHEDHPAGDSNTNGHHELA